jgi:TusE/DsrC/DsvC family sulfur relay protein
MVSLIDSIIDAQSGVAAKNPDFPNAPEGWTPEAAIKTAHDEGLELTDEHWEVTRALQAYFAKHTNGSLNLRDLHDALEEAFHSQGGVKHLYQLLPGGPVAQGCRIAGLKVPAGVIDKSFGSVV